MTLGSTGTPASEYWSQVLAATPRLLGTLDREPLSPTWGSFDREHWAWKFRDFPISMLQSSVLPLAWLWRTPAAGNPWAGNGPVLRWIGGALDTLVNRQRRNGAFDTVGPNTQDHGVTLAQCYVIATAAELLGDACPAPLAARMGEALHRGTAFAARSAEDYAFISNHQALFALAWLRAGKHLGDEALCRRADQVIAGILEHQSPDGWFAEYGGPDPGYESLGLMSLAQFERERPTAPLTRSIDRSLEFLAYCVQPDGGLGGGYGSRNTVQWYPAGFELLAGRSETARAIAGFMRPRLHLAQVVTPQTVDAHNLPLLLYSYCLAATAGNGSVPAPPAQRLPCEEIRPLRYFADAGLAVASTPHYFALSGLKKGGVLAAFGKQTEALAYQDAGYVAELGGRTSSRWSSALLGLTTAAAVDGDSARSEARFGWAPRPVLTPIKFVLLRLLNLTVFHSLALGALVRRMVIRRLITGRRPGSLTLVRQLTFEDDRIVVRDRIAGAATGVSSLWRPRAFTAVHMGSARYYHPRDLVEVPEPVLAEAASRLARDGSVELGFSVTFGAGSATVVMED